jgi:fumarate reductase flavoprotein subunit
MVDASAVIQGYIKNGYTVTGADAASLAKEMNVDADALKTTIETWNKAVEAKSDTEFNRTSFNHQLTGNLYALTVQPGIHHTMGGSEDQYKYRSPQHKRICHRGYLPLVK